MEKYRKSISPPIQVPCTGFYNCNQYTPERFPEAIMYPHTPGRGPEMIEYPQMRKQEPMSPYYQMYGYPLAHMEEQENERDMQRLKEMYPEVARNILSYVEEECDRMEYEGSLMFDEQPDMVMVVRIKDNIYDKVKDHFDLSVAEDKDELFAMNTETRRRYPPRKDWLGDLIQVMLFQEMYRRRCRHRNCKRWY